MIIGPAHPYRGGIADTDESFCKALLESGYDASIVSFTMLYPNLLFPGKTQFTSDERPKDIKIERWIHTLNPFSWATAARRINGMLPDMVIARYWLPFLAPCLGSIVRMLDKKIVTIAMCDNVIPHERRLGDSLLTKYFISAFQGFITLSNTTFQELEKLTDRPKAYFPHPINKNLGEKVTKEEAREHLGLDKDGRYLLFFGLIRKYKGLDMALKTFGTKKIKKLNVQLLVVGEFYEPRKKYDQMIHELALKEHVTIVDQFVPTEEIRYYFSAADMVIQTYHSASQSGISQMAFNFDRPVLVTHVGGLAEIIKHKEVGYICEKDPEEIANCIEDFYLNHKEDEFSKNIQLEKHQYSWEAFSEEVLELYEHILK